MDFLLGSGYLGGPPGEDEDDVLPLTLGGDGDGPGYAPARIIFLSASTSLGMADAGLDGVLYLQRVDDLVRITDTASAYISPIRLSAVGSFGLGGEADAVAIGDKYVSAENSFSLTDEVDLGHNAVYFLSAEDSIGLGGEDDGTCRDLALSAANSLGMDGTEAAQNRDINVSATSGLGLESDPESNEFLGLAGATTIILVGAATFLISGTPASNSFALADFAQATVKFPWRRAPLTLPPGGGLPHS